MLGVEEKRGNRCGNGEEERNNRVTEHYYFFGFDYIASDIKAAKIGSCISRRKVTRAKIE